MGLRALFQNAAKTAFRVAGDIPLACVYRQDKSDALSDAAPVEFPIQALFGRVDWRMITEGRDVLPGDATATVRAEEMQVRPERGDTITTPAGAAWRVIDFADGTGEILISLHVRRL
jgi:hypothetical protein